MKRLLGLLLGMVWGGGPLRKLGAKIEPLVGEVVRVDLVDTQVTDVELVHLAGLTNLKSLILPKQITDAGLVHLHGAQVSDGGVELHQTLPDCGVVRH